MSNNSKLTPIKRTDYTVSTSNWQSNRQPIVNLYQYGKFITLSVTGGTQTAGKDTRLLTIPSDIVPHETLMFPVFQYYNTPKIVGVFRIQENTQYLIINHDQDMTSEINFISCNLYWFI